jgi:hypothetical protein
VRTVYVQDPETKKFIEKKVFLQQQHAIHTMKPFVSPITKELIRDAGQLRSHNAKYGVTDSRDYGPDWFDRKRGELENKRQGLDKESKNERIQALISATDNLNRRT